MRILYLLFLTAFVGVVGLFAYQNQQEVSLAFGDRWISVPIAAVAGIAFVLGMLSGWTIVGMLRRSLARVIEPWQQQQQQTAGARW